MVENRGKDKIFNIAIMVIMGIYALITLFPLLHVLANSFSSSDFVNKGSVGTVSYTHLTLPTNSRV